MMQRRLPLSFLLLFLCFFLLITTSCEKFDGNQTVPAYISIDSIFLQSDVITEGTASHNITDAWVYIDDVLVGAFQMPANFPVLFKGKHDLTVIPGIKRNGIAATRTTYPFYNAITRSVDLAPDSTYAAGVMKTTYMNTTVFTWKESFDATSITIDTTKFSKADLELTPSGSPLTFEGLHSGMIQMNDTSNFFEIVTFNYFKIPSAPVYLEMNFNSSSTFQVGVIIYTSDFISYQTPILNLAPTHNAWKKIYIDLTTTLNTYPNSTSYKIFMGGYMETGLSSATILIDNLKIVTR